MSRYKNFANFDHQTQARTGVLLVNLGSPGAATSVAVRKYLAEFLWDPRVVEIPRPLWWMLLHGIVLRLRPRRSAKAYQKIWTDQGSPLLVNSQRLCTAIQAEFENRSDFPPLFRLAMRYGEPALADVMHDMQQAHVNRLLVVPLYPQYSATTTASVFDAISHILQSSRFIPELRFIAQYHDYSPYINALAGKIERFWQEQGRGQKLLMSFHGLPKRNLLLGDPYYCQCQKTARLLAQALDLGETDFLVTFQSRFGRAEWLQPYTDKTLQSLPAQGVRRVDVVCPGFAADCLETLEEIAVENRAMFLQAGGEQYQYIPALNSQATHVSALCDLIQDHLQGWNQKPTEQQNQTAARARALGAER